MPDGESVLKGLEGRSEREEGKNRPREFFWDSVVLFVIFAIIGLTAVDVISEFVRGSSVECFADLDNRDTRSYINTFCSGSSVSEYFPVFMVVHGIIIGIPHYLWLNHYGGSFELFFQLTSELVRLRDYKTGEYAEKNYLIVEQLEAAFSVYKQNWIFYLYLGKLILQWFLTVGGFFVAVFFFTDFNANFLCPQTLNETFDNFLWPLPDQQVNCVFTSLRLIELLRIADLILLAIVVLGLSWSLIWCASTHSSELGSRDVAVFAFQSGLAPKYHIPKFPVSRCCIGCRTTLHKLFSWLPSLLGPRISTDLDFMVMKLFRTDGGLGHVLREVQILKEINSLNTDERRRYHLHEREQNLGKSGDLISKKSETADLKWTFEFIEGGVYRSYEALQMGNTLVLPNSIRGAVLGYASRSAHNKGALYITFGSPSLSFAETLGRIFKKVGCFNFSPYYNNPKEPVRVENDNHSKDSAIVSVTCAEDYLTGYKGDTLFELNEVLRAKKTDIWEDCEYSFILVNSMDKESHISTVNYFLDRLVKDENIAINAILLYIRPINIAGMNVEKDFKAYEPPRKHFDTSDRHRVEVKKESLPWYALTKDGVKGAIVAEEKAKEEQKAKRNAEAKSRQCCPIPLDRSSYESFDSNESSLSLKEVTNEVKDLTNEKPRKDEYYLSVHSLPVLVGDADGIFEFSLYKSHQDDTADTSGAVNTTML